MEKNTHELQRRHTYIDPWLLSIINVLKENNCHLRTASLWYSDKISCKHKQEINFSSSKLKHVKVCFSEIRKVHSVKT